MTKSTGRANSCGRMGGNTTVVGFVANNTEQDLIKITKEYCESGNGLTGQEQSGLNKTDPTLFIFI